MDYLTYSLTTGLWLSLGLSSLILASLFYNPEIWVGDYPPDVRAAFGPIGSRAKKQRNWFAILFFILPVAVYIASLPELLARLGTAGGFWQFFLHSWVVLQVFNLVDLLLLDWLIFVRIQPRRIILPGTEGLPGYKDYSFHFKGFLAGNLAILALSPVFAGITLLFT